MVEQELADSIEVLTDFRRHDMERAAQRQDGIHILDMSVEGEGTVSFNTVFSRQVLHIDDHIDEVPKTGLMQHGTLRLTCRT